MKPEAIHFVTGKLAEHALRSTLAVLAKDKFDYSVDVLPISVAALMTPQWIAKHILAPENADRVIVPGYCRGDLAVIEAATGKPVERGPRDLLELPEYFGQTSSVRRHFGEYDIEIIAEINHAPQMSIPSIVEEARQLTNQGADIVDIGCNPGDEWNAVGDCVKRLREDGIRVSIDSFNPNEIEAAAQAGAELVLSVNRLNRAAAADWGCEVVVIPDDTTTLDGLEASIEYLEKRKVNYRIDPILEPIGCGFASSLRRYMDVRQRYRDANLMMGIGNLTELTDVDSAGVNVVLLGICQELGIGSVLTTQVINWARSSVRECDLARRLVHYAVKHGCPPKNLDASLVMLRDPRLFDHDENSLATIADQLKDRNYRVYAARGELHLLAANLSLADQDPFALFDRLLETSPKNMTPSHAFYLGYELCKAALALNLGKQYRQDEALDWGMLTVPENSHRLHDGQGK